MSWVKLDTSILTDPDIVGLTDGAFRTYINGLAYCGEHLTDGLITTKGLRVIRAEAVDNLTECGLWVEVDGDFVVRNYLEHQQSRSHVEETREKARKRAESRRTSDVRKNFVDGSREHAANYRRTHNEVPQQNTEEEYRRRNNPTNVDVGVSRGPVDNSAEWSE